MIGKYFELQLSMLNRRFKDLGFQPVVGFLILLVLFLVLSISLFNSTEYAQYLFIAIGLAPTIQSSDYKRIEFIKSIFPKQLFVKVRIIESIITSLPFALFLTFRQFYLSAILLVLFSIILGLTQLKNSYNFTFPTPFSKKPFEFTTGFRRTFYLFPIVYILGIIAYSVDNFNLAIFSMMLIFLIYLTYYHVPEDEYFVWTFNLTPQKFILEKIKIALLHSTYLLTPMVMFLGSVYFDQILYIVLFLSIGYAFLICMILSKYSVFPQQVGLVQYLLISVCIYFPPILILLIPIFYSQSVKRLKHILS